MKFELKTYKPDKKTVDKTYRANRLDISFGTVRGFLKEIPFDDIDMNDGRMLGMLIMQKWEQLIPLYTDIFPGLTEEELDTCKIGEMAEVIRAVFVYITDEIRKMNGNEKN